MLALPTPDLRALIEGEVVVAFTPRGAVSEGDEVALAGTGTRPPEDLKPAYARWHDAELPAGDWGAIVEAVHPSTLLDPETGSGRHILATIPDGDLVVLRVFDGTDPVLSDEAHEARRRSVEGALR